MNGINSFEELKSAIINCLKYDVPMEIEGEYYGKDVMFEVLELCRTQINN